MSRFFKKFTRKKNLSTSSSSSRDGKTETANEIEHGFVDSVGGINFPTSPNADSLTSRKFSTDQPELTVFWSQPRYGRNTQRVNPIFVNEPTELYEAAFIPPDNAHDFSVLPRYRVNDSRSMYGLNAIDGNEENNTESSMYRSRSLGAIPSFNYDNEGLNLVDLKHKRRDEQNQSTRGLLFGLFKEGESSSMDKQRERDSGVYPTFDNEEDDNDEPIEEILARKLAAFHSDESGTETESNETHTQEPASNVLPNEIHINDDNMINETIRESNLIISALESSCTSNNTKDAHTSETTHDNAFEIKKVESANFDSEIHNRQVLPTGRFIRSKSVPDFNESSFVVTNNSTSAVDINEDFNSIERTLHDLEFHLTDNLVERTQSSDPKALREKQLFNRRSSPTLGALPRGRVSSVKKYLEGSQERSKSVSNLSTRNMEGDSDSDDDYGVGTRGNHQNGLLRSARSFGNIDPNSLSPLLNDRKYFGNAILKNGSKTNDIPSNSDHAVKSASLVASSEIRNTKPKTIAKSRSAEQNFLPSTDDNIQVTEGNFAEYRVETLNRQLPNTHPSSYMHAEGDANTVTADGVAILNTRENAPVVRKKPTIGSFLKAVGKTELPEFLEEEVYPDRACKRTIMQLMVRCYNFGNDCDWTGELSNLQDHLEQCQKIPVPCINACGRIDIPRNQMNQHIEADGDCPLAVVLCRYNDIGCKHKARRVEMDHHLQESLEQHLDLAHSKIHDLEVRQENICMNGKFLWKISNYDHLVKQSATKKDKEKLCSPPFYTGQYGYKLRAEAFLNGLGQGKGTHLSLYVVIMKGEYDAILPWPFKQNVDFVLIDQDDDKSNRQNKVWKLSCERNSDYFQRPNKAKSLGFGCPKFVSLETLKTRNYIRDQTLFIKIEVEPTDHLIFTPATAH